MQLSSQPKRILVSPLRFIGDAILAVPLLRALREAYPEAQIDFLVSKQCLNLFEICPYTTEILPNPGSTGQLLSTLRPRQYDLVISMRRSVSDALWFKLAGCRRIIGFDEQRFPPPLHYRRWGWFLDDALPFPLVDTEIVQVKTVLSLLTPLGITPHDEHLELWATEEDKLRVASLFNQLAIDPERPVAVFHATSASREKALAPEQFVPALQRLGEAGMQIVTLGAQGDAPYYDHLANLAQVSIANGCGKTTLRQSYALMLKIQLLLSLDSAPIHMATAAGVPHIVGIYGPTNEKQWRPYPYDGHFTPVFNANLTCRPCVPKVCEHNRCRVDLSPVFLAQALAPHLQAIGMSQVSTENRSA